MSSAVRRPGTKAYCMELTPAISQMKESDFSEIIAACDLTIGRCRQLIEFMEVCGY